MEHTEILVFHYNCIHKGLLLDYSEMHNHLNDVIPHLVAFAPPCDYYFYTVSGPETGRNFYVVRVFGK